MAKELVPDELWAVVEPLLPPHRALPGKRGRPPVPDREALSGILFVLRSGIPWEMLPKEMGCGSGDGLRIRRWAKGYDDQKLRQKLRQGLRERGIVPRIARRGVESREKLGRYRWVAERTFSWQQEARRVRDERRDDIYEAFTKIENARICWERLNGHFC